MAPETDVQRLTRIAVEHRRRADKKAKRAFEAERALKVERARIKRVREAAAVRLLGDAVDDDLGRAWAAGWYAAMHKVLAVLDEDDAKP